MALKIALARGRGRCASAHVVCPSSQDRNSYFLPCAGIK